MYLASACQNFIEWQNTFLQPIVDANMFNGILHNYVDTIIKKIPLQEAKRNQIVLIEESFLKSETFSEYFSDNIINMLLYIPNVCDNYNLRFGILRLKTNYKMWNIAVLCMLIDGEFHHVFYKEN